MGGTLVCVVAALLWWTNASGSARPIFYVAAILTLAAAWETSRMGSLALYDFFPALALAAFAVLALTHAGLESAEVVSEARPAALPGTPFFEATPSLLYGYALLTALAAYALFRLVMRLIGQRTAARLVSFVVIGALILYAIDDVHALDTHLTRVLLVFGGISVLGPLALEPGGFGRLSLVGLLSAWIVPALPLLVFFHAQFGIRGLIALLVLSKIGDTCGYYVGSAIGKSHPFPKISPGKTTAGCVGSFVGAVATGGILYASHVLPDGNLGLTGALLAAAVANLAAQAGDLLESYVKRKAGVKDSSGVFGPSGGLLDQLDSLLVSVPIACLVWPILLT